jgi:membrane protease YdiL (CAAX protease family)
MDSPLDSQTQEPPGVGSDKWSVVLRAAFFIATVFIGVQLLTPLLYWIFGVLVAGTVGLCATGLLANLLTMKIFDRRHFDEIGLKLGVLSAWHLALGLLFGGGCAGLMLLLPIVAGAARFVPNPHSEFTWIGLVFYLAVLFIAASGEEMIFRGYVFQMLVEKMGPYATLLPLAVIFGLTHSSNPHVTWLAILNTTLWGVILGYAFLRSRDLWLPIGLHYGWNAVLPLFGVNLSGLTIDVTRYNYQWDLGPLWSGGGYGPEGGVLTTIFAIGLFVALYKIKIKPQTAYIAVSLNEPDPLEFS